MKLVQDAAKVFATEGFDVEIVEKHHNQKLDAPSGTALALADSINEAMGNPYEYVYDRSQRRQKRDKKELGISAVRGGTIVGEHDVIFAGKDEVITFSHTAYSKAVFGKGAVWQRQKFLKRKDSGPVTRWQMSLRQTDRDDKMRQVQIKDIVKAVGGKLVWGDENATVTNVSTDSREVKTGTLFVPIIGERVDAHRFIPDVLEAGASCVFFSDDREKEKKGAGIYVSDTLLAMQKFAAWYRSKLPVRIIGITGSVGKTTTKEMIAAVLETKYRTVKTYKNLNSQIGVALMMFELVKIQNLP